jgi:hypothetical protein
MFDEIANKWLERTDVKSQHIQLGEM